MSKFKVIKGGFTESKVLPITRVLELDKQLSPIEHTLSNKGLVTYAYHYATAGAYRRAENLLDKVAINYFVTGIYKDLYHALFCWSAYLANKATNPSLQKESEYFVVVKRSLPLFKTLEFKTKPYFMNFYKDHLSKLKFTDTH